MLTVSLCFIAATATFVTDDPEAALLRLRKLIAQLQSVLGVLFFKPVQPVRIAPSPVEPHELLETSPLFLKRPESDVEVPLTDDRITCSQTAHHKEGTLEINFEVSFDALADLRAKAVKVDFGFVPPPGHHGLEFKVEIGKASSMFADCPAEDQSYYDQLNQCFHLHLKRPHGAGGAAPGAQLIVRIRIKVPPCKVDDGQGIAIVDNLSI